MFRTTLFCAIALFASAQAAVTPVATINSKADYDAKIKGETVIMFSDPVRCNPCKKMKPFFFQAAEKHTDVQFGYFDTANRTKDLEKIMDSLNIRGIPCLIFFRDGKEVMRSVGGLSASALDDKMAQFKKTAVTKK